MRDFFSSPRQSTPPHESQHSQHSAEGGVNGQVPFHCDAKFYDKNDFPRLRRLPRLVFPPANSKEWNTFDHDLKVELRYIISVYDLQTKPVAYLMEKLTSYTYWFFENRLPKSKPRAPNKSSPKPSKHPDTDTLKAKMRELRRNIRKNPTNHDKSEYHLTRKHYLRQRNLEELRLSHESEFANNRRFRKNPDSFARNLLNPPKAGDLKFVEEEANAYFTKTYFDHDRQHLYNNSLNIPKASIPSIPLDLEPPSFKEFSTILKRCRNGSAPGPNGIPYLVWKRCPTLSRMLYSILS